MTTRDSHSFRPPFIEGGEVSSRRRTTCQICGGFIKQAARGRPRLVCSDACRREKWDREHGTYNIDGDAWLLIPAKAIQTRSDYHLASVDSIADYLEGRLAQVDASHPGRSDEVRVALANYLVPWLRRLSRGQSADMADLFGLARLLDRIAPLPGFNEASA